MALLHRFCFEGFEEAIDQGQGAAESVGPLVRPALKKALLAVLLLNCIMVAEETCRTVSAIIASLSLVLLSLIHKLSWIGGVRASLGCMTVLLLLAPLSDEVIVWRNLDDPAPLQAPGVPELRIATTAVAGLLIPLTWPIRFYFFIVTTSSYLYMKKLHYEEGWSSHLDGPACLGFVWCYVIACFVAWHREQLWLRQKKDGEEKATPSRQEVSTLRMGATDVEIMMSLCDCVIQLDADWRITASPRDISRFFGEFKGCAFLDFVAPQERHNMKLLLEEALSFFASASLTGAAIPQIWKVSTPTTLVWSDGRNLRALAVLACKLEKCTVGLRFEDVTSFRVPMGSSSASGRSGPFARVAPVGGSASGKGSNGELTTPFELAASEEPNSRANTSKSNSASSGLNKPSSPTSLRGRTTSFELTLSDTNSAPHSQPIEPSSPKGRARGLPPLQKPAAPREFVHVETQTTEKAIQWAAIESFESLSSSDFGATHTPNRQRRPDRPPMMPQPPGAPPLFGPRQRATSFCRTISGSSDGSSKSGEMSMSRGLADLRATTPMGQLTAVLMLMEMLHVTKKSCCRFHSTAALVGKLGRKLMSGNCDHHWECHNRWQCSSCTCLQSQEPEVCVVCGTASGKLIL